MPSLQDLNAFRRPWVTGSTGFAEELPDDEALRVGGVDMMPMEQLGADREYFLDPNGDDVNGVGTLANPWRTPQRVQEAYASILPGEFTITVNIANGTYTGLSAFEPSFRFGNKLVWTSPIDTQAFDFNSATAPATDANYPGLEFIDVTVDAVGHSVDAGDYIRARNASGGTNPQAIWGWHKVISTNADDFTFRVWRTENTTEEPSGAISDNVLVLKTIFQFANQSGLIVDNVHAGDWTGVAFEGDSDGFGNSSVDGVSCQNSGIIFLTNCGVASFRDGLQAGAGSRLRAAGCGCSQANGRLLRVGSPGTLEFNFNAVANGVAGAFAGSAGNGGNLVVHDSKFSACSGTSGCFDANRGGFVNVEDGSIFFDAGGQTALVANNASDIIATGATITGYATTKSPATNPGNGASNIVGP